MKLQAIYFGKLEQRTLERTRPVIDFIFRNIISFLHALVNLAEVKSSRSVTKARKITRKPVNICAGEKGFKNIFLSKNREEPNRGQDQASLYRNERENDT